MDIVKKIMQKKKKKKKEEKMVREGIDEEELQTFFKVAKQIRENLEQMQ